uniref:Uncharacterized protein n=1 Tax=Rhizophora mucronata TaxID=61149 RepID=A0A2P2NV96_RHIMU
MVFTHKFPSTFYQFNACIKELTIKICPLKCNCQSWDNTWHIIVI